MSITEGTLFLFMGAAFASVIMILITKNIFYAALSLMGCVLSLAAVFALLQAEFLFITQIVIYAGGIIILILFSIMLTNRVTGKPLLTESRYTFPGVVMGMFIFCILLYSYSSSSAILHLEEPAKGYSHIDGVGIELLTTYSAPFELSGVLLLVCLVGAILTAYSFRKELR